MKKKIKQWFTVALLYPCHMTDDYGKDIFVEWAKAADIDEAVAIVRKKAVEAQRDLSDKSTVDLCTPGEFDVCLVWSGRSKILGDYTSI